MKNPPPKPTANTKPKADGKTSLLRQSTRPRDDDPITEFFAHRPETKWPKPSAINLAQIAIRLGNGPKASHEAVRLIWECALAQENQVATVRRFRERQAQYEEDLTFLEKRLSLKPEDYSVSHASFLSNLNLDEIQVRSRCLVRGHKLWMEFVRQLPTTSLFRDILRESWGDKSFFKSASGQSAEEWENERRLHGWTDAEIILWFIRKFGDWRQQIISANKRKGGKTKKPRQGKGVGGTKERTGRGK